MPEILTFGYQGLKMDKIIETMVRRNAIVLDIRFSPYSPFPGWKKQSFQEALGDRYMWVKGFGNVNYKGQNGGQVRLYDGDAGMKVITTLGKYSIFDNIALMCACPDYQHCHRKTVAYLIESYLNWPITHLKAEDIMGVLQKKQPSEATMRRQAREQAKGMQTSLFNPDDLVVKFKHRDDS